jgi:hypothetical protein
MSHRYPFLFVAALATQACSTPKPEPEIASAAPQGGYAARFPEEVQHTAEGFGLKYNLAKTTIGEMPGYPNKLKTAANKEVLEVYDRADESGKSYAYVERARELEGAKLFFDEEKEEITKKVAGSAQHVAKEKGCDVDVYSAAAHSLKESVDKQIEKRMHERSEAHLAIERHQGALGKENVAELEKQADAIAAASYVVHIELVEHKVRLNRLLGEIEAVKKSTDDAIAAERAAQAEKRTDAEKKQAEERVAALEKSKGLLDSSVTGAKSVADSMEQRIAGIQKEYADALAAMKAKVQPK